MWEDFQKALEKRVKTKRTVKDDKHLIMKTCEEVLNNFFGEAGKEFIEIRDYKNKVLILGFKNSTWRNEFKLSENKIKEKINNKLKEKLIQEIKLI